MVMRREVGDSPLCALFSLVGGGGFLLADGRLYRPAAVRFGSPAVGGEGRRAVGGRISILYELYDNV